MTAEDGSFRAVLTSLWLRLITLSIILPLFLLTAALSGRVRGWFFYLTPGEVAFEIGLRALVVALAAAALGTALTIVALPFLVYRHSSRQKALQTVTHMAVGVVAFGCIGIVLDSLAKTSIELGRLGWFPMRLLFICYCVAFALAMWIPVRRRQIVTSLDGWLERKTTRRIAVALLVSVAAIAAAEGIAGNASASELAPHLGGSSSRNIVLITFDALSAEDMSVYGYRLSTTPNLDEFAKKSSVFTHFFSGSTFTTPSVATILTGLYPSESHVYQLEGSLKGDAALKTFPRVMQKAGYATAASVNNPAAWFLAQSGGGFEYLPEPAERPGLSVKLWGALWFLHQPGSFGSRMREDYDLRGAVGSLRGGAAKYIPALNEEPQYPCTAADSFAQARSLLKQLPADRFFLWVHLLAPHSPYLPGPAYLGRFLKADQVTLNGLGGESPPRYSPSEQAALDKSRLRYDELLAEADAAFGSFMTDLEASGRLRNAAVIVSADHGESFQGGFYGHDYGYQTRPTIHVPLIIRMPGQQLGYRTGIAADETSLAPTLLEIAGVTRPEWMRGDSLVPWLTRDGQGDGEGLAFNQYLAVDSIFKPIDAGTAGVIDGRNQYVLNLSTGKGKLRGLGEAQMCDLDRSNENPALAQTLREAIYTRFPYLPRRSH